MLSTRKLVRRTLTMLLVVYVLICILLYFLQEKLIFFPNKLAPDHQFSFRQPFEEIFIGTKDGEKLHGLLFPTQESKGLIFYLHGNAGAMDSWGSIAETYTNLGYDIFLLDYRGYGKSNGTINSQSQFFSDAQTAYDSLKNRYLENKIIITGYSIGTGPAAYLVSVNHAKLLVLQAPYYSLTDVMKGHYPFIPTFLLKYKFPTYEYLQNCRAPVVIFHGDRDEVIDYGSSLKLKLLFKKGDTLITLKNQGHNGITENLQYQSSLTKILGKR